jgi:hypothetical protein
MELRKKCYGDERWAELLSDEVHWLALMLIVLNLQVLLPEH